jgi:hypothetical protein
MERYIVESSIILKSQIGLAVLENLDAEVDIKRALETIRENIKMPAKEARLL